MRNFLAAALTLFFFSTPARAHVFLEPNFGFETGSASQDFKYTNAPENKSSYNQNGLTYGGAFGYRYNRIYGAAEYEKGMGGHVTDMSALIGINIAIKLRLWFGYIFSAKDDVSSGTGYKVGLGTSLTRIFRLNAEYDSRTYYEYTAAPVEGLTYSGKRNSFRITISFPWQVQ